MIKLVYVDTYLYIFLTIDLFVFDIFEKYLTSSESHMKCLQIDYIVIRCPFFICSSGVCPQLKWKTFNASDSRLFTLMVNAGNDSFGNKFYICRSRVINGQMKPGQMFNSKCFISHNGSEYAYTHFQVLTNPNKINMKWHHVSSQDKTLPSNAVAVEETAENGSKNTLYIGRCQIRMLFYQAEVIGYSSPSEKTIDELHAPFDGKQISCQYYQLLICN